MMYVILLSGVSLFGLLLLVLGVRGRRIDDHPLCRKCKYDLVGTADLQANCPECGSELSRSRATRFGNRKRKRKTLVLGLLIFTTSLTGSGFLVLAHAKNFDWYPYKPLWMLSSELTTNVSPLSPRIPNRAQMEVIKRLKDDELSKKQIHRLVEKALRLQADLNTKWDHFWGDFVEDAWYKEKLTSDQLHQYMATITSSSLHLSTRSVIRQGETVYINYGYGGGRTGRTSHFIMSTEYGPLRIGDIEILSSLRRTSGIHEWYNYRRRGREYEVDAPIGKLDITLDVKFRIAPTDPTKTKRFTSGNHKERYDYVKANMIMEWFDTISIPIEVVEPDTQIIELVDDPELKDKIRNAIRVQRCGFKKNLIWVSARIEADKYKLPMPVAFKVIWRVNNKEWLVNEFVAGKSQLTHSHKPLVVYLKDFPLNATSVDVILRSSVELAEEHYDLTEIWQGEIIFPYQPLILYDK